MAQPNPKAQPKGRPDGTSRLVRTCTDPALFRASARSANPLCKDTRELVPRRIRLDWYEALVGARDPLSPEALSTPPWAEFATLRLCRLLADRGVSPSLPRLHSHEICANCSPDVNRKACINVLYHKPDYGTLTDWMRGSRSLKEYMVAFFQIFVGLYALQEYFNITLHNVSADTVLVYAADKEDAGGHSKYVIYGQAYYVPNTGFTCVLSDFSSARIPGVMEVVRVSRPATLHGAEGAEDPHRKIVDYKNIVEDVAKHVARRPYGAHRGEDTYVLEFARWVRELFAQEVSLAELLIHFNFKTEPEGGKATRSYEFKPVELKDPKMKAAFCPGEKK